MNDREMLKLAAAFKLAMDTPSYAELHARAQAMETGSRYPLVQRGFQLAGATPNRLYDGAPPLNPETGKTWKGVLIDCPRALSGAGLRVGYQCQVTVGDQGGGLAFREFVIGPGSPVYLALGQYQSVKVNITARAEALGTAGATPARLQWVDWMPSLPDAGLLRAPGILTVALTETAVPDGAIEVWFETTCQVRWFDYSGSTGAAPIGAEVRTITVAANETVRTQGVSFDTSVPTNAQFFLAGL